MDDDASYENTANNLHMQTLRLGSTKSKLYIDCVSLADIGQYTCVAETPFRRIATTTLLSIGESGDLFFPYLFICILFFMYFYVFFISFNFFYIYIYFF